MDRSWPAILFWHPGQLRRSDRGSPPLTRDRHRLIPHRSGITNELRALPIPARLRVVDLYRIKGARVKGQHVALLDLLGVEVAFPVGVAVSTRANPQHHVKPLGIRRQLCGLTQRLSSLSFQPPALNYQLSLIRSLPLALCSLFSLLAPWRKVLDPHESRRRSRPKRCPFCATIAPR